MVGFFSRKFFGFFGMFRRKKKISLGLYGPPNAGKSTLANRIIKDILGEDTTQMFSVSDVEHETREIQEVEKLVLKKDGKELDFSLIDTPGIATKIDFEDFVEKGMGSKDAKERARQATKGVIDSIKWLDNVDAVIIVLDSSKNPYTQVNITLIGNLVSKKKKVIIAANKSDLSGANLERVKLVFLDYLIVPISAKTGEGIKDLYEGIFKEFY